MTFGFSLYAIPLQVTLVAYFERGINELKVLGLSKGGKVCVIVYLNPYILF